MTLSNEDQSCIIMPKRIAFIINQIPGRLPLIGVDQPNTETLDFPGKAEAFSRYLSTASSNG